MLRRALPQVLAGEQNLNRAVRWVHVVDVAEPDELLRGGELVLSTGLGPGHDQVAQRRFIRSLAEQQAAGLLVEIGYTYKQVLPRALVAEAAARGLPLIETHRPTRFVDITEAIHGALVDRRLGMLRRAQEAGDRMTSIVLEHGRHARAPCDPLARAASRFQAPSPEEAASDLGANAWVTFQKVTFPIIFPGILAGALMAFALSIDDFVTSNFVAGVNPTFPLWVYGASRNGIPPQVLVFGTFIFMVGFALAILSVVIQRRKT